MAGQGTERTRRLGLGFALGALVGALLRDLGVASLVSFGGDQALFVPLFGFGGALLSVTRLRAIPAWGAALAFALWSTVCFTPLSRAASACSSAWATVSRRRVAFVALSRRCQRWRRLSRARA